MILNPELLEKTIKSQMLKYGLSKLDSEVIYLMDYAMKSKYMNIIKELISISRSQQSNFYLYNKNSLPMEVTQVKANNIIIRDPHKLAIYEA
jgi:hypothetical protein